MSRPVKFSLRLLILVGLLNHSLSAQVCTSPIDINFVLGVLQNTPSLPVNATQSTCFVSELDFVAFRFPINGQISFEAGTTNPPFSLTLADDLSTQVLTPSDPIEITGGVIYLMTITAGNTPGSATINFRIGDPPSFPTPYTIEVVSALPVVWSAPLTFQRQKDRLHFDWSVSEEREVAHYALERSVAGSEFLAVDHLVPAAPNSKGEIFYRLFDVAQPTDGYYRIRQEDLDGSFSYSNTILVPAGEAVLRVYPNPASGSFRIAAPREANVTVFDVFGRSVSGDWSSQREHRLEAGTYWITVATETGEKLTKKLVVR